MSPLLRPLLVLGTLCLSSSHALAYKPDGRPLWPNGTVTMQLQMGSSPLQSDGSDYNASVDEALKQWNRNLGRLQFASVIGSSVSVERGNGYNNVALRDDIYGEAFGENVLAVTLSRTNETSRIESDVLFNKAETWGSYRGPLDYSKPDIRRVALHEFGHVLGLTHPDQAGQYVTAIMNSLISSIDALQKDDQDGGAFLYGPGVDNQPTPPTISTQPTSQNIIEGQSVSFYAYAYGTDPITYQWRKDGADIAGAIHNDYRIEETLKTDAGSYTVVVTNPGGSVTSSTAMLTVTDATPPTLGYTSIGDRSAEIGSSVNFSGPYVSGGSPPIRYQWYKDGVAVSGATSPYLTVHPVTLDSAGSYVLEARNAAGSARTQGAKLTVLPQSLPPLVSPSPYDIPTLGKPFSISTYIYSSTAYRFQWYKDGQPIAGANLDYLSFSSLRAEDAGEYLVILRNDAGATASLPVTIAPRASSDPTAGTWLSVQRHADTFYFLYANPARIERYHNPSGWLSPIMLNAAPAAFAVDESGLYVSLSSSVRRYAHDGSGETTLATISDTVAGLLIWKDYLLVMRSPSYSFTGFTTLRRDTGAVVATSVQYYYDIARGLSIAPQRGRIFGRNQGVSPSDVEYVNINVDGTYGTAGDSPYHGDFPDASRTWVNLGETQVADDSGTVYNAADLTLAGSLGGPVTDLADYDDGWVVLRGNTLVRYDSRFMEVGQARLPQSGGVLFIVGDEAVVFCPPAPTTREVAILRQSLTDLSAGGVADPIAPPKAAFSVDDVFMGQDGVVHILSRAHRNLFRWSAAERAFLESIPLRGSPAYVAYSDQLDRVFFGYKRLVTQVDLSASVHSETPFVVPPIATLGLTSVGEFLLLNDAGGYSTKSYTYNTEGDRLASRGGDSLGICAWNSANRRLYRIRGSSFEATEIKTDGTFGQTTEVYSASYGSNGPIRIDPSGANILLGSGTFVDAGTLLKNNALANAIEDAVWMDGTLYTMRNLAAGAEFQRWSSTNYSLQNSALLPGRVLRFFGWGSDKFVAVGLRDGYIFFAVMGTDFSVQSIDEHRPPVRLSNLSARAHVGTGDNILIPGFIIGGSGKKKLLIRAAGPGLEQFEVSGVLSDPQISVHGATGATVASNDHWGDSTNFAELSTSSEAVKAFEFAAGSKDAALLVSLDPGSYTVHTRGAAEGSGISLVELYDVDDAKSAARLTNISARAQVGVGDQVLIPGIIVDGDVPGTVLVRAIGPGLTHYNVSGVLADPQLQILDKDGRVVATNDNWDMNTDISALTAVFTRVNAFWLGYGSKDAAVVVTLPPGSYTAHIKGADNTTGVALVEVYYINQ